VSAASAVYTRLGDDGTTGRLHGGRLGKDDDLIELCGDIDETVSALGLARAALDDGTAAGSLVLSVQRDLFVVAADVMANPRARDRLVDGVSRVVPEMTARLEDAIDALVAARPLRPVFVVPGATTASAALDLARSVCRRAERRVVRATRTGAPIAPDVLPYLNRLGDLLYVLARATAGDGPETPSHD
jgi:cob(I)alamin adenosyltransferase